MLVEAVHPQQRRVYVLGLSNRSEEFRDSVFAPPGDHVTDHRLPMPVGNEDVLGLACEGPQVPQGADSARVYAVTQGGVIVVGLVYVAVFGQALIEPCRNGSRRAPGGLGHQQVDELVGSRAGDGGVVPVDQQHPLVGEGHALRL